MLRRPTIPRNSPAAALLVGFAHELKPSPDGVTPFNFNRYQIHQYLPNRTWRDLFWFSYAWTVDTLCQTRYLFVRDRLASTLQNLVGRAEAVCHIIWRTVRNSKNAPGHARQKYECKAGFVIQDAPVKSNIVKPLTLLQGPFP